MSIGRRWLDLVISWFPETERRNLDLSWILYPILSLLAIDMFIMLKIKMIYLPCREAQ